MREATVRELKDMYSKRSSLKAFVAFAERCYVESRTIDGGELDSYALELATGWRNSEKLAEIFASLNIRTVGDLLSVPARMIAERANPNKTVQFVVNLQSKIRSQWGEALCLHIADLEILREFVRRRIYTIPQLEDSLQEIGFDLSPEARFHAVYLAEHKKGPRETTTLRLTSPSSSRFELYHEMRQNAQQAKDGKSQYYLTGAGFMHVDRIVDCRFEGSVGTYVQATTGQVYDLVAIATQSQEEKHG